MPVELRLEDAAVEAPTAGDADADAAGAAVLRDLIAAGIVTHEAIGDPARLGGEAAALRALCRFVAGPVYRLEPFHYAFAIRPDDLGGGLAGRDPEERTAALGAALAAKLGPETVWIGAADLPPAGDGPALAAPPPAAALLVLRAQDAAAEGLAAADPGQRAVIDAGFAAEAARRAADVAAAVGIGARDAEAAAVAAVDRRLVALETRLEAALAAQAEAGAHEARAFEARLGLALAEFLARLERRAEGAAAGA